MSVKRSKEKSKKGKLLPLSVLVAAAGGVAYAVSKQKQQAPPVDLEPEQRLIVKDEENLSGLGTIMKGLLSSYAQEPAKARILDTLNVSIAIEPVEQPDAAITMTFANGRITIEPGAANADIKITCEMEVLLQLAQMPAGLAAVKFMTTPEGQELAGKFISGDLRIKGLVTHPVGMLKFSQFLAPSDN